MARSKDYAGYTPVDKASNAKRLTSVVTEVLESYTGGATCAAAVITSAQTGTYDMSVNNALTIFVSRITATTRTYHPIVFTNIASAAANAAAVTVTELVTAINGNALAAKLVTASDSTNHLRLTTKDKGTQAKIYVTGTANTPLGFTQISNATGAAGTGTDVLVELQVLDLNNDYVSFAQIDCVLYAGSTGDTKDATAVAQNAVAGSFLSGEFSNTFSVITDKNGVASFYVTDTATGVATTYVGATVTESAKALATRITLSTNPS